MNKANNIYSLNDTEMFYYIFNDQFLHIGDLIVDSDVAVNAQVSLIEDAVAQLAKGVIQEDHYLFRVSLANVICVVYRMSFLTKCEFKHVDLRNVFIDEHLFPREDYVCYVDDIYSSLNNFTDALKQKNIALSHERLIKVLAHIYYQFPEFCRFTIRDDLEDFVRHLIDHDLEYPIADLKSVYMTKVKEEKSKWSCYPNYKFKAYSLIESELASRSV